MYICSFFPSLLQLFIKKWDGFVFHEIYLYLIYIVCFGINAFLSPLIYWMYRVWLICGGSRLTKYLEFNDILLLKTILKSLCFTFYLHCLQKWSIYELFIFQSTLSVKTYIFFVLQWQVFQNGPHSSSSVVSVRSTPLWWVERERDYMNLYYTHVC